MVMFPVLVTFQSLLIQPTAYVLSAWLPMKVMEPMLLRLKFPLTPNAPALLLAWLPSKRRSPPMLEMSRSWPLYTAPKLPFQSEASSPASARLFLKITSPVTPAIFMPPPVLS